MFVGFSSVGFCGSRSLAGSAKAQVCTLASLASWSGTAVFTTCGSGAAAAARACAPSAHVFHRQFAGPAAFAARATQLVRALAVSPTPALLCWPGRACPVKLLPGTRWQSCGSGSWSELALAVGLGVTVFVFGVPAPASWGKWSPVESGPLSGAWVLRPVQPSFL